MTGKLIDLADHAKDVSKRPLRLRIDKAGCLEVTERNAKGAIVREWGLNEELTDTLVSRLFHDRVIFKNARAHALYVAKHPEEAEKAKKKEERQRAGRAWRKCRLNLRGYSSGRDGCQRRSGHEGKHKDASGHEFEMLYPHHRLCGTCVNVSGGGAPDPSIRYIEFDRQLSPFEELLGRGKVAVIAVGPDGRCLRCKNFVGPRALEGGAP